MTARTHPAPDRRRIVGSWVLAVVLGILTLTSLTGNAEASADAPSPPALESRGAG